MANTFNIQPVVRFDGECEAVKRPKEIACFSYDDKREFHLDDRSLQWYYPPELGADLSGGFDQFDKHDNSKDEHIDSLLKTIMAYEEEEGKKIDVEFVTWRGMMTKILSTPFEDRDGFEMNATFYQGCIFIEENHAYGLALMQEQQQNQRKPRRGQMSPDVMTYWGYKFETLSCLPRPWGEVSRAFIENRDKEVVNNKAQYCSVVRTGIGKSTLCIGGEVDAIWDSKPAEKGAPINWIELKTSVEIRDDRTMQNFERKLMKFWIQSFLLGVPKIIVGFRSQQGILTKIEEIQTAKIPETAAKRGVRTWNANVCINFASAFLEWLKSTINDEGVWRIRRRPRSGVIEVFKVEEVGHGRILTDEFINWRIKLSMNSASK
ncbi:RAI1-domain-containing protein [Annulohypoxylon truncatum]|uniref:RAI1-domain-containing protein n=1 Tax=Annulohypoxylon truncatum TaxID=327061 RepID=UPI0020077A85|nr:RAI1-domain-containing protein [Annulohypoxylon truncatum]KAI1214890.1 RAI1-domain-containing protein [Annulohypoxylon truncatum]